MCDERCRIGRAGRGERYDIVGPNRRQFISQSMLAAVAALLTTGCGDGEIGGAGAVAPQVIEARFTVRIADFPALQQVGGIARVDRNTANPVAVSRLASNTFAALSMTCPHIGYKSIDIVASGFRCPNHGALFAADGDWNGGLPTDSLQSYPITYNAATGTLTIG